ncbi:hypothetical protein CH373_05955 [Leptospira perolatii]|uniref:Uncharacterized protein n=2 Tax=Leptospira perolatii TaxID=2023191 RepID=A0A2M9ZRD1_9LEPT|nr:hypothetical protein CH360_16450 [Leptospira perolatii]PJZ74493.1 hypothetical protein CH373_05955 [Leptospira perolatii]
MLALSCSSGKIQILPEPVMEQITFRSLPVCVNAWFCGAGDSGSLSVRGLLNNRSGEKTLFLEYYMSTFEESFPVGLSLKLDQTWHNLRKVSTEYGQNVRVVSLLPVDVYEKIQQAKEVQFSFTSREKTVTHPLSKSDLNSLQKYLSETKSSLDTYAKLNIANH